MTNELKNQCCNVCLGWGTPECRDPSCSCHKAKESEQNKPYDKPGDIWKLAKEDWEELFNKKFALKLPPENDYELLDGIKSFIRNLLSEAKEEAYRVVNEFNKNNTSDDSKGC